MTVANDDRISGPYVATAGQTVFDGDYEINDGTEVTLYRQRSGVVTIIDPADYVVTLDGAAPNTFSLTLDSGATLNDIYSIFGDTVTARASDFTEGGDYFASTVNSAEDRQYWIMQELTRDTLRSVRMSPTTNLSSFDPTLPPISAGKSLQTNSAGNAWTLAAPVSLLTVSGVQLAASAPAYASYDVGTGALILGIPQGISGISGISGVAGLDGLFTSGTSGVSALASNDSLAILLAGASGSPRYASAGNLVLRDVTQSLLAGYTMSSYSGLGSISGGTVTPDPTLRNIQHFTNAASGGLAIAPFSAHGTALIDMINASNAGAVTTSAFTKVTGDSLTTSSGHKFRLWFSTGNAGSHLHKVAMQ